MGEEKVTPEEVEIDRTQSGSLRDRLRAKRDELRTERKLELVIPGYDGELGVRYRPIAGTRFEKLAKQAGSKSSIEANAGLVIACCECIIESVSGEGWDPLLDDQGRPIKFDNRLAEFLGFDAQTAIEVVAGTFSPDGQQELAVFDQAIGIINWMRGRESRIDDALLGE